MRAPSCRAALISCLLSATTLACAGGASEPDDVTGHDSGAQAGAGGTAPGSGAGGAGGSGAAGAGGTGGGAGRPDAGAGGSAAIDARDGAAGDDAGRDANVAPDNRAAD